MKSQRFILRILPIIIAAVFLSVAVINFYIGYAEQDAPAAPYFGSGDTLGRQIYFLNFYISTAVCFAGLCGLSLVSSSSFIRRWVFLAVALAGAFSGGYVVDNYFSVNLWIYASFALVIVLVFPLPVNLCIAGIAIASFIFFLWHPGIIVPAWRGSFQSPGPRQIVIFSLILFFFAGVMATVRFLLEKIISANETIAHLNQVGTKMLLFNHRLQEYIKNTGEEAVKKDRLRFTSDLHDACGYVFTNIIAISEAAISWSYPDFEKMRETFKLIQKQAQDGLKKTRETLYMIREISEPESGSIETIFQMKAILEEITDIRIIIEVGNIQFNYGPEINRTLTRIVQEAFTNSVRHGKATRIVISFWDFQDSLEMTVRDNGVGAQEIVKGIGLAGMEERINRIGGTFEAFSPQDGGFCLKVLIPLLKEKANEGENR